MIKKRIFWIFVVLTGLLLAISAIPTGARQVNQGVYERVDVEIEGNEIVTSTSLPYGSVVLWITNTDTTEHNFRIEGPGVEYEFLSPLQPGQTKTKRVELQNGSYSLSVPGQDQLTRQFEVQDDGTIPETGQESQQGQGATATPSEDAGQTPATSSGQSGSDQTTPTPADQQGDNGQQLVQQGEQVFSNNCASCHGQNGQGQVGPALVDNPFVTSEDPMPVIDTVLHGSGQMPAFEDQLTDEEIAAVVSFIRNAWGNQSSTVSVEQVSGDQQAGQQATPAPTGEQASTTPSDQQATATPTPSDSQEQVPDTGQSSQPFSVAEVAQPGKSGSLDVEIELELVADGFVDPVNVVSPKDGSGRLFVIERNGVVRIVQDGQVMEEPFLDISNSTLSAFLEQGLYDLEFHPDYANNGRFFVHFAELLRNGDSMIVEYTVSSDNPEQADPESARVILQIDQPWANHNGGELTFGPDGYLYIGSGDGGWEGDPLEAGQDLSTLLGKLLRIDVNTNGTTPYRIPEDNPFSGQAGLVQLFDIDEETFANIKTEARPEIWAYGLRNPWKFQFDPETGDLYLPDVGQNHWEEINFQAADSQGGENYGWDFLMGTYCFPINAADCPSVGVLPVAEYSHDLGNAVVGIGVYRGDEFTDLDGIYFVADWGSGRIWGLQRSDGEDWTFAELLDTDHHITGSGQDENGTLYLTTCNCQYGGPQATENPPGSLWRIVSAGAIPETGEQGQGQDGQPAETGTVRAPLENQQPVGLEQVAEGLTAPVFLTTPGDDSGRLFIVDQVGQIRIVDENGELLETPFLDVSDRMVELREDFDERGLLGLAFHPDYPNNGRFFVYYSAPLRDSASEEWNHTAHISEFSVSQDDPNTADPDSERILLQVDEPQFNHDGGTVMFGPDGYLYISLGDGGGANDVGTGHMEDWYEENEGGNGQDVSENLLGSILRIDVDSEGTQDRPYGIPSDNPFAGQDGEQSGMAEIYAYGFRNPYRFSFDRGGENQLFAADVGQNAFEEVNIVEMGGNYGWNVKEGTHCFSTETPNEPLDTCPDSDPEGDPLIDPVIEYVNNNQEDGIGISVTGGFVYRGSQIQDLQGNYVFGDWSLSFEQPQGRLFLSEPQEQGLWPIIELVPENLDFNHFVLGFGEDEDGELYVTTSQSTGPTGNTGEVFRLVPAQDNQ